jgi:hypothetical protein
MLRGLIASSATVDIFGPVTAGWAGAAGAAAPAFAAFGLEV